MRQPFWTGDTVTECRDAYSVLLRKINVLEYALEALEPGDDLYRMINHRIQELKEKAIETDHARHELFFHNKKSRRRGFAMSGT